MGDCALQASPRRLRWWPACASYGCYATACSAALLRGGPLPLAFQDSCFPRRPPAYELAANRRLPLADSAQPPADTPSPAAHAVEASTRAPGWNGSPAGSRLPNRSLMRGVAAERSDQRERLAAGGGSPPTHAEHARRACSAGPGGT